MNIEQLTENQAFPALQRFALRNVNRQPPIKSDICSDVHTERPPQKPKGWAAKDPNRKPYLEESELNRLIRACRNDPSIQSLRNEIICRLAIEGGLRASEISKLRWSDINEDDGMVIFVKRCKNSNPSSFRVSDATRKLIQSYNPFMLPYVSHRAPEYLFPGSRRAKGKPLTTRTIQRIIKSNACAAGLGKEVHPHQLRHSCGYVMASKGVPMLDIQSHLGHKSVTNTQRYIHYAKEAQRIPMDFDID